MTLYIYVSNSVHTSLSTGLQGDALNHYSEPIHSLFLRGSLRLALVFLLIINEKRIALHQTTAEAGPQ